MPDGPFPANNLFLKMGVPRYYKKQKRKHKIEWVIVCLRFTYDDHREGRWVLLRQRGLFQKRHDCSLGQSWHCDKTHDRIKKVLDISGPIHQTLN